MKGEAWNRVSAQAEIAPRESGSPELRQPRPQSSGAGRGRGPKGRDYVVASHAVRRRARALLSTCESPLLVGFWTPRKPDARRSALAMKPGAGRGWGRRSGTGARREWGAGPGPGGRGSEARVRGGEGVPVPGRVGEGLGSALWSALSLGFRGGSL